MENCLVTKLNAVVNNPELPKISKVVLHLGVSEGNLIGFTDSTQYTDFSDRIVATSGSIEVTSVSGNVIFNVTSEAYIDISEKYKITKVELYAPENIEKFNGLTLLTLRLKNGGVGKVNNINIGGALQLLNTNCYGELEFDNNLETVSCIGSPNVSIKRLPPVCNALNTVNLICSKANLRQCVIKNFTMSDIDLSNYTLDDMCVWSNLTSFRVNVFGGGVLTDKLAEAFNGIEGRRDGEITFRINANANIKLKSTDINFINSNTYKAVFTSNGISVYDGTTLLTTYDGNTWS